MGNISLTLIYSVAVSLTKNNFPVLFSTNYSKVFKQLQLIEINNIDILQPYYALTAYLVNGR